MLKVIVAITIAVISFTCAQKCSDEFEKVMTCKKTAKGSMDKNQMMQTKRQMMQDCGQLLGENTSNMDTCMRQKERLYQCMDTVDIAYDSAFKDALLLTKFGIDQCFETYPMDDPLDGVFDGDYSNMHIDQRWMNMTESLMGPNCKPSERMAFCMGNRMRNAASEAMKSATMRNNVSQLIKDAKTKMKDCKKNLPEKCNIWRSTINPDLMECLWTAKRPLMEIKIARLRACMSSN